MRRTWLGSAAAALLLTGAMAACGGDDGGSGDDAAAATTTTGAELTGTPLKVVLIGHALNIDEPLGGLKAAVAAVNADGGIAGHPVEVVSCEAGDPNAATKCARDAVADESVIASVGTGSGYGAQVNPIFEEAGIAGVGTSIRTPGDFASPNVFTTDGGGTTNILAIGAALVDDLGVTTLGVPVLDEPNAVAAAGLIKQMVADARGLPAPVSSAVAATASDQSSQAGALIDTDGILMVMPAQFASRFTNTIRQQGYTKPIGLSAASYSDKYIEEQIGANATELYAVGFFDHDSDGYQDFLDEMGEYQKDGVLNDLAASSWLAMHMLDDVAEGLPDITRATVLNAFTNLSDYDTNGLLSEPIDYTTPGTALGGAMPRLIKAAQDQYLYKWDGKQLVRVDEVGPINPFTPPKG